MGGVAARWLCPSLIACAMGLVGPDAQAQDGTWRLQGFGGWAFGKVDDENTYAYLANGDGHYNNYSFALNLAAQPTQTVALRSQLRFAEDLRGQETEVDYVFAEWTHSPRLRVRAGKVLIPFGLYSEIYDVGTLRPFYVLPQFYSGASGLMPKAYLGAGLTGVLPLGETWELSYDAFAGEVHFQKFPTNLIEGRDPATELPIVRTATVELIGRDLVGARAVVGSPSLGLQIGAGAMRAGMEQRIDEGPRQPFAVAEDAETVQLQLQYQRRAFTLRSEYFHTFAGTTTLRCSYVEASYRITKGWQVAGLYERSRLDPDSGSPYDTLPQNMREHDALGVGLSYWLSPEVVLKLDGYAVEGNLATRSSTTLVDSLQGRADTKSSVVVAGLQFSF